MAKLGARKPVRARRRDGRIVSPGCGLLIAGLVSCGLWGLLIALSLALARGHLPSPF